MATIDNISPQEASRFLMQATFGPTDDEILRVQQMGYGGWIDDQINKPFTKHRDIYKEVDGKLNPPVSDDMESNAMQAKGHDKPASPLKVSIEQDVWWQQAVTGDAQLRERLAFAWSQIFVISKVGVLLKYEEHRVSYYDMLLTNGLGNFRDLLREVTYSPIMGMYLTYIGNEKSVPGDPRRPDENYAREIMQLFTIGLNELNPDGTLRLQNGQPIPTYNNDDVREMARVFTGMTFDTSGEENPIKKFSSPYRGNGLTPWYRHLMLFPEYHDNGEKTLLGGLKTLPAGQGPAKDIDDALDCLFEHPNTPPFICRRLMQRLTTSNPSPAYLGRAAQVFVDNGEGVRGDLSAVVRAILLDPEVRQPPTGLGTGKLREPYLRFVALARAFRARPIYGNSWAMGSLHELIFQEPMTSPTVFNFYAPDYTPHGPIGDTGMVAPEFEITNAVSAISIPNFFYSCLYIGFGSYNRKVLALDFSRELLLAGDADALVTHCNLLLAANNMGAGSCDIIRHSVEQIPSSKPEDRVKLAVYLTCISPECAVQP